MTNIKRETSAGRELSTLRDERGHLKMGSLKYAKRRAHKAERRFMKSSLLEMLK